jgi:hypothetical protein
VALCHCASAVALALRRRGLVAPRRRGTVVSWRRDLHDLEVGYFVFIINAYAGA